MATLTSRLFTTNEAGDSGLDAIFKSSAGAASASKPIEIPGAKRRAEEDASTPHSPKKKARTGKSKATEKTTEAPTESPSVKVKKENKKSSKSKKGADEVPSKESAPVEKSTADDPTEPSKTDDGAKPQEKKPGSRRSRKAEAESKKKQNQKAKYVPPGEKPEDVDARTVFVGNLPASMVKNNSAMKSLIRHLTSTLPASAKARVESHRFRSVAFSQSTKSSKDASEPDASAAAAESDGDEKPDTLTTSQKKRLAFLKGEINEKAEVVNCYIVFGHHRSTFVDEGVSKAEGDEKPMLPSEVADRVVGAADGTTFMDRVIRVDRVGAASASSSRDEMKRTVFVGSLDFEAQEDDVRVFFEGLVSAERGETADGVLAVINDDDEEGDEEEEAEEEEGEPKTKTTSKHSGWVQSVRIVRDPDSQLGKGIAYVRFKDVQCVDELLALPATKLSFRKRTLRLQRCKTLPRASSSSTKTKEDHSSTDSSAKNKRSGKSTTGARVPKGDPGLGARLADLSKEERKEAKALDTDRVARRLAKKKLRGELDKEKAHGRRAGAKEGVLGKMPKSSKTKNSGVKKVKKSKK